MTTVLQDVLKQHRDWIIPSAVTLIKWSQFGQVLNPHWPGAIQEGAYVMWCLLQHKYLTTTDKYDQQLSEHVRTIHSRAISPLVRQNRTSAYSPSLNCYSLAPMIDCLHNSRDPQETPSTGPPLAISQHELTFLQSETLQAHGHVYLPRSPNTN
jgi:hypothetical protein